MTRHNIIECFEPAIRRESATFIELRIGLSTELHDSRDMTHEGTQGSRYCRMNEVQH